MDDLKTALQEGELEGRLETRRVLDKFNQGNGIPIEYSTTISRKVFFWSVIIGVVSTVYIYLHHASIFFVVVFGLGIWYLSTLILGVAFVYIFGLAASRRLRKREVRNERKPLSVAGKKALGAYLDEVGQTPEKKRPPETLSPEARKAMEDYLRKTGQLVDKKVQPEKLSTAEQEALTSYLRKTGQLKD